MTRNERGEEEKVANLLKELSSVTESLDAKLKELEELKKENEEAAKR